MTNPDRGEPQKPFEDRLRAALAREEKQSGFTKGFRKAQGNGLGLAFRVGVELVAGIIVGLGIGWFLDEWLGTRPWLMLVFILLGGAAGILNVYKVAAGFGETVGYHRAEKAHRDHDPSDDTDKGGKPDGGD